MHIGPNIQSCPSLKIHENVMNTSSTQIYLGGKISSSGSNSENIRERCKMGHIAISQIKSLMKDVNMGKFTVQTGLIFRDSIFVSKILLNSEVWHSLTQSQINELERIDKILLRHILNAHSKTGIEWLYFDTGKINLGNLWHVLSRDKTELIRRVYETQKVSNIAGDWFNLVERDKKYLEIEMSDTEIQGVSKEVFKSYVTKKVKIKFLQHLHELKRTHSKSKYMKCDDIKHADYIKSPKLSHKEKILLFKLRSRTLDVKENFKNQHRDLMCASCGLLEENQSHLLKCPELVSKLSYIIKNDINENQIYGTLEQQEIIVKVFSDVLEVREKLLNNHLEEISP